MYERINSNLIFAQIFIICEASNQCITLLNAQWFFKTICRGQNSFVLHLELIQLVVVLSFYFIHRPPAGE